jgi:hypothetical protein
VKATTNRLSYGLSPERRYNDVWSVETTDVSYEYAASIFRVEECAKQETRMK